MSDPIAKSWRQEGNLSSEYRNLFRPIQVAGLTLRNRIVMPPVTENFGKNDFVTDRMVEFYAERARGGVGLITVEVYYFPRHPRIPYTIGAYDDKFIPGLRRLSDAIHAAGAKCEVQIIADGHVAAGPNGAVELIGPSNVPKPRSSRAPRSMSIAEIGAMTDEFVSTARRCLEAGFDFIQIHCSAGYLTSQFLSSYSNRRTDRYGGDLRGRATLLFEIIEKCQRHLGHDIRISMRISGADFVPGGNTLEDTTRLLPWLEDAGLCMVNVTTGWHETTEPLITAAVPEGHWVYLAEAVKKAVGIPVITGTRIVDPALADRILGEGKADLVYIARALIADPEWPTKALCGRTAEIRPCTTCCECFERCIATKPIICQVNPRVGKEARFRSARAELPLKVVVVGGGPAGLEAANTAAAMGHKVTLYERHRKIGGLLIVGCIPPHKQELKRLITYYDDQLLHNGVTVKLGQSAGVATIAAENPDAVIVATGSTHARLNIPGANRPNVCTASDVLLGRSAVGKRVVIVGAGLVGCETAEFLAMRGASVKLLGRRHRVAYSIGPANRWGMLQRLTAAGVQMQSENEFLAIDPKGIMVRHQGEVQWHEADTVVVAIGMQPDQVLGEELLQRFPHVWLIGDCKRPARITTAIDAGFRVAYALRGGLPSTVSRSTEGALG